MQSHIFLTGATGTIGLRWLPLLLEANPTRQVTILVRDASKAMEHPRVTVLTGDLRTPQLGLTRSMWEDLCETVTEIIHCAAEVRFHHALEEARTINTEGTRRILALARESRKLRGLAYISTTYIMGRDEGELPESAYRNTSGFVNTYEQSKYEAEQLVLAAMDEIPATVFRPSSIVGERTTYLQRALRVIPRNSFRLMPGLPQVRVDLIDERWVVRAMACLFERHLRPGAVFHICAGRRGSMPVGQLVEMAFSSMGVERRPKMVALEQFEQFTEFFESQGAREVDKLMLRALARFLPHLALDQTFLNDRTMSLLEADGIRLPNSVEVFRQVLARVSGELARSSIPAGEPVG